jgi:HK97 family phage prohead protease
MPYYITNTNPECDGWAVEKEDGEVIGCHNDKQSAIDQMVAVSIAEDIAPGGERALPTELEVGDYVSWNTSGGRARGEIVQIERDGRINVPNSSFTITGTPDDPAALIQVYQRVEGGWEDTDVFVGHKFSTLTKIQPLEEPDDEPDDEDDDDEMRQVDLTPPAYMRASARRGLQWYSEGLGGDGLVDRTIREAREMAEGRVSADKWVRIQAWIARHLVDLDAPDANPNSENFPSAGVVAMALWGGGTTKRSAQRAQAYAEGVVARLEAEEERGKMKHETRNFDAQFELREEGDGMTFVGYAAKFNSPSEDLGGFVETIEPGAFRRSLRSRNDVKLLVNHDTGRVLASSRSGTMRLYEDETGLRVEASLPNTSDGRDMAELLKRGDLNKMSFGFAVQKDSWNNEMTERTLKSVRLFEVSIVAFPAYAATEALVRSLDKAAKRAAVDADQLADAVLKLEEGADLSDSEAELIKTVVNSLTPTQVKEEEPTEEELNLLDLKRKQLDLLLKRN